ncbi:MAG: hypothetical protein LBP63_09105 [Prevotellaceae bacterium]|jgi:hypothetical protein|nr:hypothetical protein [Prevotellaceae bacterium]
MKKILNILLLLLFSTIIMAQEVAPSTQYFAKEVPLKANKEFQFLGYYINQAVLSNMYPENDFLKGQIVGRLFGANTAKTSKGHISAYVEQRLIPFFIYTPNLFDGKVTLRASFEIDWTWGDLSYGVGGNFGSAFSADQVNLQTQNVELEFNAGRRWTINLGLQRVFDTPYNPYRTTVDKMGLTGYRMAYFGTDGVGISVRKDWDFARLKTGYYKLYENLIQKNDDVTLLEVIGEKDITKKWKLGASIYYLADRGNGNGGVSILGQGLNSLLAMHNGVYRFDYGTTPYRADIGWVGAFFGRNTEHWLDPWMITGFVNVNIGKVDTLIAEKKWKKATDILGFAANLRTSYRYGQTLNDVITLDALYSSGDENGLKDKKYSGVITGNQYGAPGAIFISSGAYILMPHSNVVNRYTPAVMDISNMGYGITAITLNASKGIIPNTLNAKIGGAFAMSNVKPKGGGNIIGGEINGSISYNLGPYMSLELHGAYMILGNFYDSAQSSYGSAVNGGLDSRPVNPWTTFLVFKWLMF